MTRKVRVEISHNDRSVVVDAAESMERVADKALEVWRAVAHEPEGPKDQVVSVGFSVSDPVDGYLMPPEAQLPHRLIPEQEGPDERR